MEIFKGSITNWIQRVRDKEKNLKRVISGLGNWEADQANHVDSDNAKGEPGSCYF